MEPGDLLLALVQSMVSHPEHVDVKPEEDDDRIVLHLSVHRKDRGQVLGTGGDTAECIRTILNAVGGKIQKRILLKVKD